MIEEFNLEELEKLASDFALKVKSGDIFFLKGDLGAGKSTFARAFIRSLGVKGAIPSPTFIIDSVYNIEDKQIELHHIDLYRLQGTYEEIIMLGLEDIFESDAVVLMEWPERLPDYKKRRGCEVIISEGSTINCRRVKIEWNLVGY